MKKESIDTVLIGSATNEQAVELATWFATESGQVELSKRIDVSLDEPTDSDVINREHIEKIGRDLRQKINSTKRRRAFTQWAAAAVIIPFLMLLGAALQGRWFSQSQYNEVVVANGDKVTLTLSDNSTVVLNSGSKFRYPTQFGIFERRVYLEGQAYFTIENSASREFIVDMGDASVTVLGTEFDVEAYNRSESITVTLDSGSVSFECPTGEYLLKEKQQLTFDARSLVASVSDITRDESATWRHNVLSLERTPMSDLLGKLSRQYGVEFKIVDQVVLKYTYSLHSDNQQLEELLSSIERITPVRFTNRGRYFEVTSAK